MGSLFKFKRAASEGAASWKGKGKFFGSRKTFFEKKWKFSKKSIDNRKRNRLNGRPFQIQTSGFGRGGQLGMREGKVLWNLLSTIVRTCQKFFWRKTLNKKKSNESIRNWYRRWTLQEILKKILRRVWFWLRVNAGGVVKTCKSSENRSVAIRGWESGERVRNT